MLPKDYDGDFSHWQKKINEAGARFDVSRLSGCTYNEIDSFVETILWQTVHRKLKRAGKNEKWTSANGIPLTLMSFFKPKDDSAF
jgi:hypothetical protein